MRIQARKTRVAEAVRGAYDALEDDTYAARVLQADRRAHMTAEDIHAIFGKARRAAAEEEEVAAAATSRDGCDAAAAVAASKANNRVVRALEKRFGYS